MPSNNHALNGAGEAMPERPPRDDLFRALLPGVALRSEASEAGRPIMYGHFSKFGEWAEIDSLYEGHFLERVAPGAFAKTIAENQQNMRVLFHHGKDQLGVQVLGKILALAEDEEGAAYEVELFEGVPQLVMDGLRAGVYGSSYRFQVLREDFIQRPKRSEHNPQGIPERTIREAKVREFGPTPFPAFEGATSGVRSITDEFVLDRFKRNPERAAKLIGDSTPFAVSMNSTGTANYLSGTTFTNTSTTASNGGIVTVTFGKPEETRAAFEEGRLYERTSEFVSQTPWAMHPAALATVKAILEERRSGVKPTKEQIEERLRLATRDDLEDPEDLEDMLDPDEDDENEEPELPNVAVISLKGCVIPHATLFSDVSGACSLDEFAEEFAEAVADENVDAILLDVDSPGGSVALVPETAQQILEARGSKPIVASVNAFCASAAYWLASAADEICVTPSGQVGSIGVYSAHEDISQMLKDEGVKMTLISAGKYKTEGNPFEPLTPEAEQQIQDEVNAYYEMFVSAVAAGRGVTAKEVTGGMGQGRMVMAADATGAGMADRVETFAATLARLQKPGQGAQVRAEEPELSEASTPEVSRSEPSEATTNVKEEKKSPAAPLFGAGPAKPPANYSLERKVRKPWQI